MAICTDPDSRADWSMIQMSNPPIKEAPVLNSFRQGVRETSGWPASPAQCGPQIIQVGTKYNVSFGDSPMLTPFVCRVQPHLDSLKLVGSLL